MLWVALAIAGGTAAGVGAERRWRAAASAAARRLLAAVLYGLAPFVVFVNMAHLETGTRLGAAIVLAWVALAVAGGLAYWIGRRWLRLGRAAAGSVTVGAIQANSGYLGVPLVVAALGADRLPEAVLYDALVGAPAFLLGSFGVAAAVGTRAGEGLRARASAFVRRNPPLVALAAGLLAPAALAPAPLVELSRTLVLALLPIGFLAVGVLISGQSRGRGLAFAPPLTRPVAAACALRLVVAPALLLALAGPLVGVPPAFLVLAATPAGVNTVVVAQAYGLDERAMAATVAWSTLFFVPVALGIAALA